MLKKSAKIEFTDNEIIIIMAAINKCVRGVNIDPTAEPTLENTMPILNKISKAFVGQYLDDVAKRLLK